MEKHLVHLYMFSHYYSQIIVLGSNSIVATSILYTNHVNYMATENLSERKKEGRKRRKGKEKENFQSHTLPRDTIQDIKVPTQITLDTSTFLLSETSNPKEAAKRVDEISFCS